MATRGINKVILVGHLGNDPEMRYMPNGGGAVVNLTLATSESWRDKNTGEQREKTEWHRVVMFGKLAEVAGEYLRKGSQVYVEGQLQTRKWQDQNGQDRYTTEVVLQPYSGVMQMLGGRTNQDNTSSQNSWGQSQQPIVSTPAPTKQQYNNAPPQQYNQQQFDNSVPQQQKQYSNPAQQNQQPQQPSPQQQYNDMPDFDDDIPF